MVCSRKMNRRLPYPAKQMLLQPTRPCLTWNPDFMERRMENGRKFTTLKYRKISTGKYLNRRWLFFSSSKVAEMINRVIEWKDNPNEIRNDKKRLMDFYWITTTIIHMIHQVVWVWWNFWKQNIRKNAHFHFVGDEGKYILISRIFR